MSDRANRIEASDIRIEAERCRRLGEAVVATVMSLLVSLAVGYAIAVAIIYHSQGGLAA